MRQRSAVFQSSLLQVLEQEVVVVVVEVEVEVETQQQVMGHMSSECALLMQMVPQIPYAPVHLPNPQGAKLQPRA
jgi:hypothetical protein